MFCEVDVCKLVEIQDKTTELKNGSNKKCLHFLFASLVRICTHLAAHLQTTYNTIAKFGLISDNTAFKTRST